MGRLLLVGFKCTRRQASWRCCLYFSYLVSIFCFVSLCVCRCVSACPTFDYIERNRLLRESLRVANRVTHRRDWLMKRSLCRKQRVLGKELQLLQVTGGRKRTHCQGFWHVAEGKQRQQLRQQPKQPNQKRKRKKTNKKRPKSFVIDSNERPLIMSITGYDNSA